MSEGNNLSVHPCCPHCVEKNAALQERVKQLEGYERREIERCHSLATAWDALMNQGTKP